MAINTYLSIITLNVNELNFPIKRQRVAKLIKENTKTKTHLCCSQDTPSVRTQTESEGIKKDIPCNRNEKKAELPILISDKIL